MTSSGIVSLWLQPGQAMREDNVSDPWFVVRVLLKIAQAAQLGKD
jgi:hypothetical protein